MGRDSKIIKSFSGRDELNPNIWLYSEKNGAAEMRPEVRDRLLEIANEFIEFLDVDVFIDDIVMTGSLANYNWSQYSDVDLHIIIDFDQFPKDVVELYQKLFGLKKQLFNTNHDITIKGFEVELYAQDDKEPHASGGLYSILFDGWLKVPKKEDVAIDKKAIAKKTKEWMLAIDDVIEDAASEDWDEAKALIKRYKEKLKKYRTSGLEKEGEYSVENLVFKVLRRNGYIKKLYDLGTKLLDKKLSLRERQQKALE